MSKKEVPHFKENLKVSSEDFEVPHKETLDDFSAIIQELTDENLAGQKTAVSRKSNNRSADYRGEGGQRELSAFYAPDAQVGKETTPEAIQGVIRLFTSAKGKFGDEELIDSYYLVKDREGKTRARKESHIVSERQERLRARELGEAASESIEAMMALREKRLKDIEFRKKEEAALREEGVSFLSEKKLRELNDYLRGIIRAKREETPAMTRSSVSVDRPKAEKEKTDLFLRPEDLEAPKKETLEEFVRVVLELALGKKKKGYGDRGFENDQGVEELLVAFNTDRAASGQEPIVIGMVSVETPHSGGEFEDEIKRDIYTIRKDQAGAFSVTHAPNIYSKKRSAVENEELNELKEFRPKEALEEENKTMDRAKKIIKAEHEARLKGARFVSEKNLAGLTIYLKQFLDQLQEQ